MKLAAIYNVWDGEELLQRSIDTIKDHVQVIIIVYQTISNMGESHEPNLELETGGAKLILQKYSPVVGNGGTFNEQEKRNLGLAVARQVGCTHFLHMDVDEFYQDFGKAKQEYIDSMAFGSVCRIFTYFCKPTWRLENLDGYYVPFIHRLQAHTTCGRGFAYTFYCDPTRVVNEANVVCLTAIMHHFSWVRKDIYKKARNSSAAQSGNRLQGLLADYNRVMNLIDPTGCEIADMGGQKLVVVDDIFNLGGLFSTNNG